MNPGKGTPNAAHNHQARHAAQGRIGRAHDPRDRRGERGRAACVRSQDASGRRPPALHHHDPAELYLVERGEFAFYIADGDGSVRRSTAGPGDVVSIPGGREHTVRNESDAESAALVVFSPGEAFECFVRAAAVSDDPAALAAEHGIEMTRPLEEER